VSVQLASRGPIWNHSCPTNGTLMGLIVQVPPMGLSSAEGLALLALDLRADSSFLPALNFSFEALSSS